MDTANEPRTVYNIPAANIEKFEAQIAKLSRRAMKLVGEPIKSYVVGYDMIDHPSKKGVKIKVFNVLLDAVVPKVDGWSFIARLDHASQVGNIIRSVPNTGVTIPESYRTVASNCDHCNVKRRRNDTFLMRCDATGEFKQLGSTCLTDFFGHDPYKMAIVAEMLGYAAESARAASEYNEVFTSGARYHLDLETYLAHAASVIRRFGWVSKKTAFENENLTSSAEEAFVNMTTPNAFRAERLTDEDCATAAAALEWTRAQADNADLSDYMHNLCVVAKGEVIEHRSMGIAASMISAYLRSKGSIGRKQAVDLGGDMKGVLDLFNKASASKLRNPSFVLLTKNADGNDEEFRLSLASATSSKPGTVNVMSLGSFETRQWYGRINLDGSFTPSSRCASIPAGLTDTLKRFAAEPVKVATEFGKLTGRCCVCNKALTDARSAEVGYGKTCASKMGWPWGATGGDKPKRGRKAKTDEATQEPAQAQEASNEFGLSPVDYQSYQFLTEELAATVASADWRDAEGVSDAVRMFERAHNIPEAKRYSVYG